MYRYREDLKSQGVYLSVTGPFSQILMEGIANMLKQQMERDNIKRSIMMNVFGVVVEQVQNIIHYSAEIIPGDTVGEKRPEVRIGTLVIGYEDEHYFVSSGNMVRNETVEPLKAKLSKLSTMTRDELKKYYKEQRRKPTEPGSKGAGLGLIDMTRKASKPLEFVFQAVDPQFSFFSIKIVI